LVTKKATQLLLGALGGSLMAMGLSQVVGARVQDLNPILLVGGGLLLLLVLSGQIKLPKLPK